jgi:hypothetical protein
LDREILTRFYRAFGHAGSFFIDFGEDSAFFAGAEFLADFLSGFAGNRVYSGEEAAMVVRN